MGGCASSPSAAINATVGTEAHFEAAAAGPLSVCSNAALPAAQVELDIFNVLSQLRARRSSSPDALRQLSRMHKPSETQNDSIALADVFLQHAVRSDPADASAVGSAAPNAQLPLVQMTCFSEVSQQPSKGTIASGATCCRDPALAETFSTLSSTSAELTDLQLDDLPNGMSPTAKLTYLLDRITFSK